MKKLRNLVVVMCLMLCTVMLVACGGNELNKEASVSKKGYVSSNKEEFTEFAAKLSSTEENTDLNAYKLTLKMDGKYEKAGIAATANIFVNIIVTVDAENKINGMAMKFESGKLKMNVYYTDGYEYLYFKDENNEYKYKVAADLSNVEISEGGGHMYLSVIGSALMSIEENEALGDKITYKKAVKGSETRFNVNYTLDKTSLDFYIQNTNDKTTGAEMNMKNDNLDIKLALTKFTGKIDYPSFKKYSDVTEVVATALTESIDTSIDTITTSMQTFIEAVAK